jgi:hypothetical protein
MGAPRTHADGWTRHVVTVWSVGSGKLFFLQTVLRQLETPVELARGQYDTPNVLTSCQASQNGAILVGNGYSRVTTVVVL